MALINCDFFSESLGLSCSMNVILPQKSSAAMIGMDGCSGDGKHPVLYLLHGLSDDHSIWLRRTSIERYAAPLGLAVVMPAVHRSFYTDMKYGGNYWKFVSQELPAICRSFFPLSDKREDNFVAGLSMGGYGALKLALRMPDNFAAAASLSGATDIAARRGDWPELFHLIFGDDDIAGSNNDLFALAGKLMTQDHAKLPALFQCCGTEDFLYQDNIRFRDHMRALKYPRFHYQECPGSHEWGFWDNAIRDVLAWLPLRKK